MILNEQKTEFLLEDRDFQEVPEFKDLTPEAIEKIKSLAKNFSSKNVGLNNGLVKSRFEEDFKAFFGIEKASENEAAHVYFKRAGQEYTDRITKEAGSASKDAEKLRKLQDENEQLKKDIENGAGDVVLKRKVASLEKLNTDFEMQIKEKDRVISEAEGKFQKQLASKDSEILDYHVEAQMSKATEGKAYRSFFNQHNIESELRNAKAELYRRGKPEYVRDANGVIQKNADGSPKIQLRGADGNILTNTSKAGDPYAVGDLFLEILKPSDIFDTGRSQTGTGTSGGGAGSSGAVSIDAVRGAKTKPEADAAIRDYLAGTEIDGRKVTTSHPKFREEFSRLRKDHNVASLPYV